MPESRERKEVEFQKKETKRVRTPFPWVPAYLDTDCDPEQPDQIINEFIVFP